MSGWKQARGDNITALMRSLHCMTLQGTAWNTSQRFRRRPRCSTWAAGEEVNQRNSGLDHLQPPRQITCLRTISQSRLLLTGIYLVGPRLSGPSVPSLAVESEHSAHSQAGYWVREE